MESHLTPKGEIELDIPEIELFLKALGYYQIHIFDQLSNSQAKKEDLDSQSRLASSSIKKLHKLHEKITGKSSAK